MRTPFSCESMACLMFLRSPWLKGLSGLCCTFYYSFLTTCGMDESLGLHSLHLISFFGLGLTWIGYGPFFLQFDPYLSLLLVYGLTSVPTTPFHCSCHVTTWLVLAGPLLGLPRTFLLYGPFFGSFHSFGHPQPTLLLWASLAHFVLTFL